MEEVTPREIAEIGGEGRGEGKRRPSKEKGEEEEQSKSKSCRVAPAERA